MGGGGAVKRDQDIVNHLRCVSNKTIWKVKGREAANYIVYLENRVVYLGDLVKAADPENEVEL